MPQDLRVSLLSLYVSEGNISFEPSVDVWIDVNRMELRDVLMEGSFQGCC